jgi:hypothetical protein
MMMNRWLKAILTLVLLSRCSTNSHKQFRHDIETEQCDAALGHVPENNPTNRFMGSTKHTFGSIAAYTFVGFGYTAEVLWDVAGGTVMAVALCGIPVALSVATASSNSASDNSGLDCLPGKIDALGAPPLGRRALAATADLRCPDLTGLSRSLRSVASCYSRQSSDASRAKAKQVLTSLQNSDQFYECLPEAERHAITNQMRAIDSNVPSGQ